VGEEMLRAAFTNPGATAGAVSETYAVLMPINVLRAEVR